MMEKKGPFQEIEIQQPEMIGEFAIVKIIINANLGELVDALISNGVTVREQQKPLTVEEAQSIWPRMAYVEKRGMEMAPYPVLLVQDMDKEHIGALEFGRAWRLLLPVADYGRMYRLWDGLPTEEERKAAEWL